MNHTSAGTPVSDGQDENTKASYAFKATLSGLVIVFSLVSVIGNILVAVMFVRTQSLRTSTNYFVTSMAISDLLYGITLCTLFFSGRLSVFGLQVTSIGCKIGNCVIVFSYSVSIISLVFITIDKFIATVLPIKATMISGTTRTSLIIASWILPMGFSFPFLYFTRVAKDDEKPYLCVIGISKEFIDIYNAVGFVLLYLLPFLLVIFLNFRILKSLRRSNKVFPSHGSRFIRIRNRQNQRLTKILVSIIVFIFFCWTAYYICVITLKYFPTALEASEKEIFFILSYYFLPLISTAFNPSILFLLSTNYRRELRHCC